MLVLEVVGGSDQGRFFPLPAGEPQLVGRSSESLPLTDRSVSRRHAELTPDGEYWFVRDLDSANGTWVNGKRIESRQRLREGDEITCGETTLRLVVAAYLTSGPAAEPSADVPLIRTVALTERGDEAPLTLEAARARLRMMETLSSLAVTTIDPAHMIERAVDLLVEEFAPEVAFALMVGEDDTDLSCATRRGNLKQWNTELAQRVRSTRRPLLALDASGDPRFEQLPSVQKMGLRSVMAAPLEAGGGVYGVLMLETRSKPGVWDEEDVRLLIATTKQVSMAVVHASVTADQLRQTRLASMGETVATISHAVKNIMQGLRGGAGALELSLDRGDLDLAREAWPILSRNLDRIHDLTFNMLTWSRSAGMELNAVQVGSIVQEAVDLLETQCRHRKITISIEGDENLPPIPVDSAAVHQAILNLLTNAMEAVETKTGRIIVRVAMDDPCEWLTLSVEDNGTGVEPDRVEEIFQPFTSTKGQRGTGLGLAVTRKIAQEHGGSLTLDSTHTSGARFQLTLPVHQEGDPGGTDTPRAGSAQPDADDDRFDA